MLKKLQLFLNEFNKWFLEHFKFLMIFLGTLWIYVRLNNWYSSYHVRQAKRLCGKTWDIIWCLLASVLKEMKRTLWKVLKRVITKFLKATKACIIFPIIKKPCNKKLSTKIQIKNRKLQYFTQFGHMAKLGESSF